MRFPKYEDSDHCRWGSGEYEIDWEKGQRKYKIPFRNIRVYEHGEVLIEGNGYCDIDWRKRVGREFHVQFSLLSELVYCKFFTPDHVPVQKGHIKNGVYLIDRGRMYGVAHHLPISIYAEGLRPSPEASVCYRVPNRKRESERLIKMQRYFDLGDTLNAMDSDGQGRPRCYLDWYAKQWVAADQLPRDLKKESTQDFCKAVASAKAHVKRIIFDATKDAYSAPYLIVEKQ